MVSNQSKIPKMATRIENRTRLSQDSFFPHVLVVIACSHATISGGSIWSRVLFQPTHSKQRPTVMDLRQRQNLGRCEAHESQSVYCLDKRMATAADLFCFANLL